jgi:hypothetical protein
MADAGISTQCFINLLTTSLLSDLGKSSFEEIADREVANRLTAVVANTPNPSIKQIQHPLVYNKISRKQEIVSEISWTEAAKNAVADTPAEQKKNLTFKLNNNFNIYKTKSYSTASVDSIRYVLKSPDTDTINSSITSDATSIRGNYLALTELTPQVYSALTPNIKLYRRDSTGNFVSGSKEFKLREYIFNQKPYNVWQNNKDPEIKEAYSPPYDNDVFSAGSGLGAGIKNLSFTFAGTNPVESARAINVTLELYFQSVDDLFGYIPSSNPEQIITTSPIDITDGIDKDGKDTTITTYTRNYILLISRPNPSGKFNNLITDFSTKLRLGWNFDKNILLSLGASEQLISCLESMKLDLDLELITHSLEFTENGTITLKIDYYGSLERELKTKDSSIFKRLLEEMTEQIVTSTNLNNSISLEDSRSIVENYNLYKQNCSTSVVEQNKDDEIKTFYTDEKLKEIKDELSKIDRNSKLLSDRIEDNINRIVRKAFNAYAKELNNNKKKELLDKNLNNEAISSFNFSDKIYLVNSKDPLEVDSSQTEPAPTTVTTESTGDTYYFYTYGGILQSILSLSDISDLNIICGDLEIYQTNDKNFISIADVLISQDVVMNWYSNTITAKNIENLTLYDLISSTINNMLVPVLNSNCGGQSSRSYENNRNISISIKDNNFYIFKTTDPSAGCLEDENKDRMIEDMTTRNIIHLFVGNKIGPVKSIKFKRIDVPFLREAKATSNGFIPLNTLRDVYNADVEMIGNIFFYPGSRLYIHPNYKFGDPSYSGTIANIMGIGGYFVVTKVSSTITNSVWNTTLECVWESTGDTKTCSEAEKAKINCNSYADELIRLSQQPQKAVP